MESPHKKEAIPTDRGLQQFSSGINKKYSAPLFETLALADDSSRDPKTGISIPSDAAVAQAKKWVDENRL